MSRLTFIKIVGKTNNNNKLALYKCTCGNEKVIMKSSVDCNYTKSCGCLKREVDRKKITELSTTHSKSKTKVHRAWSSMKRRVTNPHSISYKNYGGRGITICDRWMHSFENFLEDMGEPPTKDHSLDRIDTDKNYSKNNCRWATSKEQNNNRRANVNWDFYGVSCSISEWERVMEVNTGMFKARRLKGWDKDKILTTPKNKCKYLDIADIAKDLIYDV